MTRAANLRCPCGSGKIFKRCCRQNGSEQITKGDIQPFIRCYTNAGGDANIDIDYVELARDDHRTVYVDEPISLRLNRTLGDQTEAAGASMIFPLNGPTDAQIQTTGNASVSNLADPPQLALRGSARRIKRKSTTGLFVIAQVKQQRDTGLDYFDLIFGTAHRAEHMDIDGEKNRPHIALHPDGNGKFIRLSSHQCDLLAETTYDPRQRRILPASFQVCSREHNEIISLQFTHNVLGTVVLYDVLFMQAE